MATGISGVIQHTLYNDYYVYQHGYSYVDVYYQEEYDVATNSSVIKVTQITFRHSKYGGSWTVYGTVTIDGVAYSFSSAMYSGGAIENPITSHRIYHDDATGAKSINISTACNTVGGSGGTQFYEGNHGTASVTVGLTTIPRAPTISATDANVEATSAITVVKKTSSYTHSIQYQFGGLSGYIAADGSVSTEEVKMDATSIGFLLPESFYSQIKNAKTGTCTLTVKTYSGDSQIGAANTCTFTVTAAEANCAPYVSGSVVDANLVTMELTGDPNVLVRFFSEAECVITAVAQHESTIMEKYIAGKEVTSNLVLIPNVETNSFFFRAVDSRGYASTATVVKDMVPYVRLTNNATCDRTDATSGNALLKLKGNCFNGSFGAADNEITAKYKINDGEYVSITDSLTIADNAYTADITLTGLDYKSIHNIEVVLSDKLNKGVVKTITVGKGEPVVSWGEDFFKVYGNMNVGNSVHIWGDNEGGNIEIKSGNGHTNAWQIDAFDGSLRFYTFRESDGTIQGITFDQETGSIRSDSVLGAYPVGSVYISFDPTSPAQLFGGTWERLSDAFLWSTMTDANIGKTGGESAHTLTVDEMPNHRHIAANYMSMVGWSGSSPSYSYLNNNNDGYVGATNPTTSDVGGGVAHNNMPPYLEVAMWKRVG